MKAYSYLRWSSSIQTQGDSLKRQLEATRRICAEKGWELDESIKVDRGISAYRGDNIEKGSLAEFINAVKRKKIQTPCVLVIEALDRLTRTRIREAPKLIEQLIDSGVLICTANNGKIYDEKVLDNTLEIVILLMELNASHQYSENLSRRSKAFWRTKKENARKGIVLTRRLPAWISLVEGSRSTSDFKVIEERAEIIRRVFKEYLEGKGSRLIAVGLTKDKIKPFGVAKEWNGTSIFKIIKSKNVIGEYQPQIHKDKQTRIDDGESIEGYYPAIIDKEIFYKAQGIAKSNYIPHGPKKYLHNLFTGISYCNRCGDKFIVKVGSIIENINKRDVSLICAKAWKGGDCEYRAIKYVMIENSILSSFSRYLVATMKTDASDIASIISGKKSELEDLEKKILKLVNQSESFEEGKTPNAIFKRINELEQQIDVINSDIEKIRCGIDRPFKSSLLWEPMIENRDNRIKLQSYLRTFIHSIYFDGVEQTGNLNLYDWDESIEFKWDRKNKEYFIVDGDKEKYTDLSKIWAK
jgi:DNA invertase Pin-like site-specific DNA recombinase